MSEIVTEKPKDPYPGESATPGEILDLAYHFGDAAKRLFEVAKKGDPVTYAPARMCCIHAIELYLNAFSRQRGKTPQAIRARGHSLDDGDFATVLKLKKKTAEHLVAISSRREYLIARYAPDLHEGQSELNRMLATLKEIKEKSHAYFAPHLPESRAARL